jgi:feruloyl-CoA synthase
VQVSRGADGLQHLVSTEALQPYPKTLSDRFEQWAHRAPERTLVARRGSDGQWQRVTYGQMLERARAIGQGLLDAGLGPERPLAILSGNDLEHFSLAMGAMWAGIPHASVSPAYSLVSRDFGKLRHVLGKLTPGMVYVADAQAYVAALSCALPADTRVLVGTGTLGAGLSAVSHGHFDDLLQARPGAAVDAAHARCTADTVVRVLFTSGSTRLPKGVITTHRMLCSNQQMIRQCFPFFADEPPVLIDWLPWNHVFGGSHNTGIVLYNGGTLYIDDGRPTPDGMSETLRNLREISPTIYFNVPRGLEEIARAMQTDSALRERLFARLNAFFFAGAGLSQRVWDELDQHGLNTIGMRVPVFTGLGMTETAPSSTFALRPDLRSGDIGLPCPGVEVKLVPIDGKLEARFRGPHVMPGYWREPELSASAIDEEGYYCTGDAVLWVEENRPERGLRFDGRIAEDFKLSTGTFVSVGPLRARVIAAGAPLVQDVVVAGLNRDEIAVLLFARLDGCTELAGMPSGTPLARLLDVEVVRQAFQTLADRLWREGTGSASRVARLAVLLEPPSIDSGEITDKGSINQRAVLTRRSALIDDLYAANQSHGGFFIPARL